MLRAVAISLGLLALTALPALAQPAAPASREITVLSPAITTNGGLREFADAFTYQTGIKVNIVGSVMNVILDRAKTGDPAPDIVILPMNLMDQMQADGAIIPTTRHPLGRVNIGLAVPKGSPKPDISTVEKFIAVVKTAKRLAYTDPTRGSMQSAIVHAMLQRPEFAGVNRYPHEGGQGAQAVAKGIADMGLQPVSEIQNYAELDLVGPVPEELGAYIDSAVAISTRVSRPVEAAEFLNYMTRPGSYPLWHSKGLVAPKP
jgi:ABC-type molybdate transport system substrate-binding protein